MPDGFYVFRIDKASKYMFENMTAICFVENIFSGAW